MRIIAGARRGHALTAPAGDTTRPTGDRVRQALFDMLLHAPWGGSETVEDAHVLDAFAGTGALGLEALSRGAESCTFFEQNRAALACLRANITACTMTEHALVRALDVTRPPRCGSQACSLVFLDPPYGQNLPNKALRALTNMGWIAPEALIVAETGVEEESPIAPERLLAERKHGAARLWIWRSAIG